MSQRKKKSRARRVVTSQTVPPPDQEPIEVLGRPPSDTQPSFDRSGWQDERNGGPALLRETGPNAEAWADIEVFEIRGSVRGRRPLPIEIA